MLHDFTKLILGSQVLLLAAQTQPLHYLRNELPPEIPAKGYGKGVIIKRSSFVRFSHSRTKDLTAFLHLFSCTQHEGAGEALVTFRKLPRGKAKEERKGPVLCYPCNKILFNLGWGKKKKRKIPTPLYQPHVYYLLMNKHTVASGHEEKARKHS